MRTITVLARHELRLLVSLLLWVGRRRHGVGDGRAFGYARGQGAVMAGFGFVCLIEAFTMSVLLRDWPALHTAVLILDAYTLVLLAGMYAAWQVRPHVLDDGALRVRHAAHVDLRVPLDRIAAVRHETRSTHERADGELNLAVGSQTSVTLDLNEPVAHVSFLGRRRDVHVVRLHADDARDLVRDLERVLTRVRNVPSRSPDPPG
ncbi:hypothetical protein BM536_023735 [Streptomyces phaeoluteigriseus]|uniref:DUF304 domain-containing protein n=1 Tax=Streptomyces phaeoluteigriseus TaxID=114686 RepID=A0A1V6MRH0_9ACTN|nr:hypothetical protein [Streptomyces phaeoluteigriseus]OQD54873.1 hypothetical protein BM536_023735 [Streptomyces phaeoluteigriseus]